MPIKLKKVAVTLVVAFVLSMAAISPAQSKAQCPDAGIFGTGMITHVCWGCLFPIEVAGIKLGGGKLPPGAAKPKPLCLCKDNQGVYNVGTQVSMWEPARLIETVRLPYCSPTLGGVMLQHDPTHIGGPGNSAAYDAGHKAFYQFHYFAFPLLVMLNLFLHGRCNAGGFSDMDMISLSEVNPLWNDDELAFFINPETAIFSNPVAQAACIFDGIEATAGHPDNKLFWCAGTWGSLYPLTGNITTNASPPRSAGLISARALSMQHRMGLARQTLGEDALCENPIQLTIPKTQYKFEQIYPVPESNGNHWIGASTFEWGEWRNIPAVGEDFVNLIWRWNDCCNAT